MSEELQVAATTNPAAAPNAKLSWGNITFLVSTPIVAIAGVWYLIAAGKIHTATLILTAIMTGLTGVAITGGYHRLFSHKAYEASWLVKFLLLLFGAAAFENSARRWSVDHRNHHKFVDTDADPYNIKRGFWWAHMGWIFYASDDANDKNIPDLMKDPLILWQDKYYVPLGIGMGFLLPTLIASLWGDALGGLLLAGCARIVFNHHMTFSINSFAHLIGKRPYSDQNSSRDSWFLALFTYGEGYHNFHHKFPTDYRNGIRTYHWDPTKWLIKGLSSIGQTFDLRQIPEERIVQAKLRMDERRLMRRLEVHSHLSARFPKELVTSARLKCEEAYTRFRALKAEYRRLKKVKVNNLIEHWSHLNARLEKLRSEMKSSRNAFIEATGHWASLCQSAGIRPARLAHAVR